MNMSSNTVARGISIVGWTLAIALNVILDIFVAAKLWSAWSLEELAIGHLVYLTTVAGLVVAVGWLLAGAPVVLRRRFRVPLPWDIVTAVAACAAWLVVGSMGTFIVGL